MENATVIEAGVWERALPIATYLEDLLAATPDPTAPHDHYIPINQHRARRILKHYTVGEEASETVRSTTPRKWLVITEHWCGDSAQIMPVLSAIGKASEGAVEIRVLMRDQELDVMDCFLTNGGRAIPKIIATNLAGAVYATWGPRPSEATALVKRVKASHEAAAGTAADYGTPLHMWYAKDRQQSIEQEAVAALA